MLQKAPMYAYLPAKDIARARDFYEGALGFRPKEEIAGGVAYEFADGTACFLYPTENAGTSRASQAFWQVDDVEREVADLARRGVALTDYDMPGEKSPSGVITAGGAKVAWFTDTEGNILARVEPVKQQRGRRVVAAVATSVAVGAVALGALAFAVSQHVVQRRWPSRLRMGRLARRKLPLLTRLT
jgi:catechol 2,3-dioxygenase-like lactoylglutathione lyase family enzyme